MPWKPSVFAQTSAPWSVIGSADIAMANWAVWISVLVLSVKPRKKTLRPCPTMPQRHDRRWKRRRAAALTTTVCLKSRQTMEPVHRSLLLVFVLLSASLAGCMSDEPLVLEVTASETDVVVVESYQNGVLVENTGQRSPSISPEPPLP